MRDMDPRRVALLRDLLMNYPQQDLPPTNIGETPEGLSAADEDAWAEEQMMANAPPLPLEGRYPGEMGRPDAALVASGPGATSDVQAMRQKLMQQLRGP